MSGNESDDATLHRRSYLSGSLAAFGALSFGAGGVSAGDRKTRVTSDDEDVTTIDACATITEPGFYALSADLQADPGEDCIEIRSDQVLLDGTGHTISGNQDGTGVLVQPTDGGRLTTVTVSNLSLEDLENGIYFDRVHR